MLATSRAAARASDLDVASEVSLVLESRRAASQPPVSIAVSDAVALGIASIFRGANGSVRVFDRFVRTGSIDAAELVYAARVEQDYASPEGHAALYCLIGWVQARLDPTVRRPVAAR